MDNINTTETEGFGLMYYNARWYDPSIGRFAQADSIVPRGAQGMDRYAAMANNPVRYTDPSGHMWTCRGVNDDKCFDDGNFDYRGSNGGLSGMATCLGKDCDPTKDKYSWQRILYNMENLKLYGDAAYSNGSAAMNYVTASECTGYTCDPANPQLFNAMKDRYNNFCNGGNTWSERCVTSFWGYPQGILTGDERSFPHTLNTENMAAAILGGNGASSGGFTNDGRGCSNADASQLCGWGNLTAGQASNFRNEFFSWDTQCVSGGQDCNFQSDERSVWLHYQGDGGYYNYFIIMDLYVDQTYCGGKGWCAH